MTLNGVIKSLMVLLLCTVVEITYAAEFLRKQTGTTTIANGSTSSSVSIPVQLVDMSKSFLVFSSTIDNNGTTNFQIGGEITDANTLTFARTGNTGVVSISWQIFEFESGVYVQHGSSTNIARGAPVNVAISCIDLTKSFVLISARKSGGQLGADDGISANITTSTNMQLMISSNGPGGANMEEAYWQVIEYQGAVVKKLTTTLGAGSSTTTSTITPAITTLSKAFVISNHWFDGDVNADDLPRTELTNASTVTYTRVGTSTNMNFVTYVIEFTDGSTVTRGTQNFGLGVTTQPVLIAATSASGVIAPGNFGRQGSTNFSTDDNPGHNWFTYEVTTSTNLQITRAIGTGSTASAPWQIVTFEDTGLQKTTFYSRASGAWETNTTWSYTPDGSSGAVPSGVYPRRTNNVVIQNGHTVTIDAVTDNNPCSQSPNGLGLGNVGTFTGSGDQMFYHTGDILIANGGTLTSSEEVMIEGYTLIENGGTFSITEDVINLGYFEIASGATFTNTDDLILSGNSVTIINNLSFGADDIYIDHTNATLCGEGVMNLGNGSPDPTIQFFNGGSLNQVCSTFSVTCTSNCGAFPITPTGNFSSGNSGPGGVATTNGSSELEYWIDANSGVSGTSPITAWNDLSGNGITNAINGNPVLTTSALNGRSVITFDGTGDRIQTNLSINAGTRPDLSIISVYMPVSSTNSGTVWGESNGNYDRVLTAANGLGGCTNATTNGTACINNATLFPAGNSVITSVVFDEDVASGSRAYTNGTSVLTFTSNHAPGDGSNAMQVGDAGVGGFIPYTGGIAEIIVLSNIVNTAKRIIIENYLDAKYHNDAAPAFANDVYTMDNSANGDYDFEVAGIGQAADGSNHRDSRGPGVVRMWNPKGLTNSEFLMWGHDNTALNSSTTAVGTAVDGTVIQERLSRIWRVSEVGDVGNVSISFDFSGVGGSPLGSDLRLLIDRDGDGFADNDVTPIVGSVSNGVAVFSNVNFQNGDRFTLGNTDASTPLPVELVMFKANPEKEVVKLDWVTASELNNDYFNVERSIDGEQWQLVIKVVGAGTTRRMKTYEAMDYQPIDGVSYYRLRQTDFDGNVSFSPIERVEFIGQNRIQVFPNPSDGIFHLANSSQLDIEGVRVVNNLGQMVYPLIRKEENVTIDLSQLSQGIYILQVWNGSSLTSTRLVKRN